MTVLAIMLRGNATPNQLVVDDPKEAEKFIAAWNNNKSYADRYGTYKLQVTQPQPMICHIDLTQVQIITEVL